MQFGDSRSYDEREMIQKRQILSDIVVQADMGKNFSHRLHETTR